MDECKPLVHGGLGAGQLLPHGGAVQVDPIKPILRPPGSKHLKLNCDVLLSTFAFKFNLRRFSAGDQVNVLHVIPKCVTPRVTRYDLVIPSG